MTDTVDGGGTSSSLSAVLDGGSANDGSLPWTVHTNLVRDRALALLRVDGDDVDASRISDCAAAAVQACDDYLDRGLNQFTADSVPATVLFAATNVARELYERKDAPFGVLGAWSQGGEAMRIARDHLAGVEYLLMPHKLGWGLA